MKGRGRIWGHRPIWGNVGKRFMLDLYLSSYHEPLETNIFQLRKPKSNKITKHVWYIIKHNAKLLDAERYYWIAGPAKIQLKEVCRACASPYRAPRRREKQPSKYCLPLRLAAVKMSPSLLWLDATVWSASGQVSETFIEKALIFIEVFTRLLNLYYNKPKHLGTTFFYLSKI